MKLLFTSPVMRYPAAGGPDLRIENSIKALSSLTELHLVSRVAPHLLGGKKAVSFYKQWCHRFCFAPSVAHLSSRRWVRRFQRVLRSLGVRDARFLVAYARRENIQVVWFGYGNLSFPLMAQVKRLAPHLRLVCDTDSVWSRFLAREIPFLEAEKDRELLRSQAHKKALEEKSWVQFCDVTTAVSEVDATYYRALSRDQQKVAVFSNVLDLEAYPPAPHLEPRKNVTICLAGSFGKATSAMNRAALWLIHEILPEVRKVFPSLHCYLIGNGSQQAFGQLHHLGITVTGRVESILPYLQNSDVAVVPLLFESGTRFKILEAAACRVPIVSTTLGMEGFPIRHLEHLWIADTTEAFAQGIIQLLQDKVLAQRLVESSYQWVQHYGLDRLQKEAQAVLSRWSA